MILSITSEVVYAVPYTIWVDYHYRPIATNAQAIGFACTNVTQMAPVWQAGLYVF
jgi:hypothetical protein